MSRALIRTNRPRVAGIGALALTFVVLAILGVGGRRRAARRARLDVILFCRDQLQQALDAKRSAAVGPTPKQTEGAARSPSAAAGEWAAKLEWRLDEFRAIHPSPTETEDIDLRLGEATLALAKGRIADALERVETPPERFETIESGHRDRTAEALRARADAYYDSRDWQAALTHHRRVLARRADDSSVVERIAECLLALRRTDAALQTYADLARRLQQRGSRLASGLDHRGAVRDLNKAATIRLWLVEHGRRDLTADVAASFASCAEALFETRNLELARIYTANAMDIRSQLIAKANRGDLAGPLAVDHTRAARILLKLNKPEEAAREFGAAAELFASLGDFAAAVRWQEKAVAVAAREAKSAARSRLSGYRSDALK